MYISPKRVHLVCFRLLPILAILQVGLKGFSQNTDVGNWMVYMGNQRLSENLNFWNEVQYRNYNFIGDLQQLLVRTGVGYDLSEKNNNVLVGYGYFHTEKYADDDEKVASQEHRIYGQFLTKQKAGIFSLAHRYRFEERFLETGDQFRFRYSLSLNVPLNKKELAHGALYISASDEIFIKNKAGYFDRNRLYGGLGYFISDNLRMEIGFMNQYENNPGRNQFQITLFNNLPLFHDKSKS
jgi:Protein of unknown function (DUF2490)